MTGAAGWHVVIPVKPATVGKSRLAVPGVDRVALARAIARDTVAAAARSTRVAEAVVVTADGPWPDLDARAPEIPRETDRKAPTDPEFAGSPAVRFVAESAPSGLDAAIRTGLATLDPGHPRAVLLGDLPALRPSDLDAALALAEDVPRGLVPDAEGTGSTLVTALPGVALEPAFGDNSAARHRELGHADLDVQPGSTLRRDVDTLPQLHDAATLGLGPRTAALLASLTPAEGTSAP
ncbi:2-phospho-L-lactate guanylyltransferase [Microbacterium oryzae]|uniref:2-phospho-L-lactate guanylyltransferase n=1 Tax=Microbacterium oryzae TaxID=743009 RepID=UPI0025B2450A|nr:2-phospho-L-lactate guanylyltransferase [Microbacterium oryzae]MDN3310876.1 2-phospho-L-lactate guanylyltransferase [Microbacterium oryzae]